MTHFGRQLCVQVGPTGLRTQPPRAAQLKFSVERAGPGSESLPLVQKMELILDEVLATKDIKRIEAQVTVLDESESDRDY